MTTAETTFAAVRPQPFRAVRRFFKSPKGYLLLILALLTLLAAPVEGIARVGPIVTSTVLAASIVDVALMRLTRDTWIFPSGAILTGLIIGGLLSPVEMWYVPIVTAAIAIASKYPLRTRFANVFNPAALALVASYFIFGSVQSWWIALPDLASFALIVLIATGVLIANHINKLPLVLVFLGVYFALFTATAFFGSTATVAEIFRAPDVNAALFFALFMLDDPPTSPVRYRDQIPFAIIVALVSYGMFMWFGVVYYLLAGLLVGNAWEAWRRVIARPGAKATAA